MEYPAADKASLSFHIHLVFAPQYPPISFNVNICLFNYKVTRLFCFIKLNLFIFLKIYLQYLLIYNKILVTVQHLYSYKFKSIETCLQRWNLGTSLRIT